MTPPTAGDIEQRAQRHLTLWALAFVSVVIILHAASFAQAHGFIPKDVGKDITSTSTDQDTVYGSAGLELLTGA